MPLILRLWRYNRAYHNSFEWINGVFMVGKWSKDGDEPYYIYIWNGEGHCVFIFRT